MFYITVSLKARHTYIVSKIGDVNQNKRDLGNYTKTRTPIVIQRFYFRKF